MYGNLVTGRSGQWTVVGHHEWNGHSDLSKSLTEALRSVGIVDDEFVLYHYVDADAVAAVLRPDGPTSSAREIRFECAETAVRIEQDGTISTRPAGDSDEGEI